jgi:alkylation response protein AidB-like acyl-CoA dehydrogenase
MEFDVQRHPRDMRLVVIGDGSRRIHRHLIARTMER